MSTDNCNEKKDLQMSYILALWHAASTVNGLGHESDEGGSLLLRGELQDGVDYFISHSVRGCYCARIGSLVDSFLGDKHRLDEPRVGNNKI